MTTRLATFLNIRPGEGWLITGLMLLNLFNSAAMTITGTVTMALFLDRFGAEGLPVFYIASAVVVSGVSSLFLRFVGRIKLGQLSVISLAIVAFGVLLLYIGTAQTDSDALVFGLVLWDMVSAAITTITLWAVAGQVFDVRQSKRLFGLIETTRWLGSISMGLIVPLLVTLFTAIHLLIGASGLFFLGAFVLGLLVWREGAAINTAQVEERRIEDGASVFSNRYVLLIFAMIVVIILGSFTLDTIFFDLAATQFPDVDDLANFLGVFLAVRGVIGLLVTVFLSRWLLKRFSLRGQLLLSPMTLLGNMLLFVGVGFVAGTGVALFALGSSARMISRGISNALNSTGIRILYQPLPSDSRARAQVFAEGIIEPVGLGLTGLLLLLVTNVLALDIVQLGMIYVVMVLVWIIIGFMLTNRYPAELRRAIEKRRLGENAIDVIDGASLDVLKQGLNNPYPEAVIYALNLLEQVGDDTELRRLLPELLDHPAPEVRHEALRRLAKHEYRGAIGRALILAEEDPEPYVREQAIRTVAALGETDVFDQLTAWSGSTQPELRRGAMVGLILHGGIEGVMVTGQKLLYMQESPEASEREMVASILKQIASRNFYDPMWQLLFDEDLKVRRAALSAAGDIKHPRLWSVVIDAISPTETRPVAVQALVNGGADAVPAIREALQKPDLPRDTRLSLMRVCGRIGAIDVLESQLPHATGQIRSQILSALTTARYQSNQKTTTDYIERELREAASTLAVIHDIGGGLNPEAESVSLLLSALENRQIQTRDRLLFLLSFIYDPRTMAQVRHAFMFAAGSRRAYALEIVDNLLSNDLKERILPLLDTITTEDKFKQMMPLYPQGTRPIEDRLRELIEAGDKEPWIAACVLYLVGRQRLSSLMPLVIAIGNGETDAVMPPLVLEMATWTQEHMNAIISSDAAHDAAQMTSSNLMRRTTMLSTVEKVIILKTIDIFAGTPDDVLVDVAAIIEEMRVDAGETIFEKGDYGDSMYVVVSGRMRVHDDGDTLNFVTDRDVFGEMALLDPEPRLASVVALEETHLFRIEQEPFYDLLSNQSEVARGIIRVLTSRLRARVRDLAELRQQVHG